MNSGSLYFQNSDEMIEIQCRERWLIYQRLQELGIPCSCSYCQPLKVKVNSPIAAIQLWGVFRQVSASRSALVNHLEKCWQIHRMSGDS
jgi:hypothetical protein